MISLIYTSFEKQLPRQIREAFKNTIEQGIGINGCTRLFFRADDIGVPSGNFSRLMELFLKYRIPLCTAVVPAWITRQRWELMQRYIEKGGSLFCWHMHGYRHVNHEMEGKKQEFGPGRNYDELLNDLSRGHDRLESIMGPHLTKVFTPPWNRCSLETMNILKEMGFKGISRSFGNKPFPPRGLEDFPVHVDLHTRKEKNAGTGWQKLLQELETGMKEDVCGIMIHHMRMNNRAFVFLEYFLQLVAGYKKIKILTYRQL